MRESHRPGDNACGYRSMVQIIQLPETEENHKVFAEAEIQQKELHTKAQHEK